MNTHFGPEFFSGNRANLRQTVAANEIIIIAANGVMQRSGDEPASFFQDSNFWYLTGLKGPDLVLVMSASETYIIVPSLSAIREAFDGAHNLTAYAKRSGIAEFITEREGWKRLRQQLQSVNTVATLGSAPVHMKAHGVYSLPFRRRLLSRLHRINPALSVHDVRPQLAVMRCLKQPPELQALQQAIDITSETLQDITTGGHLQTIGYEYELEADITYAFRKRGADGHGFAPIVGAGKHSTTLHHMENNGNIRESDLIVLDIGAAVEHYSADISRTISQQAISGRAAEVFNAVCEVQDYALSLMKPGVLYHDYELAVEACMGMQLVRLGVISDASKKQIRRYYPHATSHFLGLDTHDAGDYRAPWQENMVLTCEPGIYLPDEGIGIRIEDDVLITAAGNKVLSKACPRVLSPVQ